MNEVKELFIKIANNNKKFNENYLSNLNKYLNFLEDDNFLKKFNEIYKYISNSYRFKIDIMEYDYLSKNEKNLIISLIIFRSLGKFSITNTVNAYNYINSDEVLNNCSMLYLNINIFYYEIVPMEKDLNNFRSECFKIIKILELEKIISSYNTFKENCTLLSWSLGFENIIIEDVSYLKISHTKPKIVCIDSEYYIIGDFFNIVTKIFTENIKSNYSFKLNDIKYIEELLNNKIYLNVSDLEDAINLFDEGDKNSEVVKKKIEFWYKQIKKETSVLQQINNDIRKKIIETAIKVISNPIIKDKKSLEEKCLDIFYKYCFDYMSKKSNLPIILSKEDIVSQIYKKFCEKYENTKLKVNVDKLSDLIEINSNFEEFGIKSLMEEDSNGIFNKIYKDDIKINLPVEPTSVNFLIYLLQIDKKEVDSLLKDNYKKIIKKQVKGIDSYFNGFIPEDQFKNIHLSVILKYGMRELEDIETINLRKNYQEKINHIKLLYSNIGKKTHIYNVLLLNKYIEDYQKSKEENILMYFIFFFDFRGRFYYHSPISPTNNKICRFLFNYGLIEKSTIYYETSEISLIISKFSNHIKEFAYYKKIQIQSNKDEEDLFWIMISLGKLSKLKNTEYMDISDFLKIAVNLKIENLKEIEDKIEFNYYCKILKSFNNKLVYRRILLKDATASFFQNLIRVLGYKDGKILKVANLDSSEKWYDWYTYIINLWNKEKKDLLNNYSDILVYFNRKNLKKIIMTQPYSATYPTSYEYFCNNMLDSGITVEQGDKYTEVFKIFYSFLTENMQRNGPFLKSGSDLNKYFKDILKNGEEIIIQSRNNDSSNLTYFKTKTKQFDFIIWYKNENKNIKKRITKKNSIINKNEFDIKKTMSAVKPNLIHFVDAVLIRDINKEIFNKLSIHYVSIHDSFMVDYLTTSLFIKISNTEISRNPFTKKIWEGNENIEFFSIFVFL